MTQLGVFMSGLFGSVVGAVVGAGVGHVVRGHKFNYWRAEGVDELIGAAVGGATFAAMAATPAPSKSVGTGAPATAPPVRFP